MSDADCTPGREPRSVAASFVYFHGVLKVDAEEKIKLLNSWFVANKLSLGLDKTCYNTGNLPRLVCGTRFATRARLLSVQMDQTPGLYAGPGVYPEPGFYPRVYGMYELQRLVTAYKYY